ncbi:MAG: peroxiredoxin [Chlamydiia bacterium]|nr:peroxiredoxin [Chlamydiia bacterium]
MAIMLGDTAPDFKAETTIGTLRLHDWIGSSWCILFSHPKNFTPVCTTELGYAAKIKNEFDKRNVKLIAISVDPLSAHHKWVPEIEETQQCHINFPIIADPDGQISSLYGMIHPREHSNTTVRTVFIIDPLKRVRTFFAYPMTTGRNFDEILRVIDALQRTDNYQVATGVNWKPGEECIIPPALKDEEELQTLFPKGYREIKPYLRYTPDPLA